MITVVNSDGDRVKTIEVKSDGDGKFSAPYLPEKDDKGRLLSYSVREDKVPGYITTYEEPSYDESNRTWTCNVRNELIYAEIYLDKNIEGREPASKETYRFDVSAAEVPGATHEMPLPVNPDEEKDGKAIYKITGEGKATVGFVFPGQGLYAYILEEEEGSDETCVYDTKRRLVLIFVTIDKSGRQSIVSWIVTDDGETSTLTEDIMDTEKTDTAEFTNRYPIHITFDANGVDKADLPDDEWIKWGSSMKLRAAGPPLGGEYVFLGWSESRFAEEPEYLAQNSYPFYRDTTLYAIWKQLPKLTLTFKDPLPGGATGIPDPITIVSSMSHYVRIPSQIPQKGGRQFIGWNTETDGSGTHYAPGSEITLVKDTTLWAQWDKAENSWYVIYDANGGKNAPKPQIVLQGKDATLSSELPDGGTLVFRGWALNANASEPDYQPGGILPYDSKKNVVILYALWKLNPAPRPITVSFDANGGKPDTVPKRISAPKNTRIGIPQQKPSWDKHHIFLGWSEDPNATTPKWVPGNEVTFDKDTILYAVWKEQYTITYKLNGGTYNGSTKDIKITYEVGSEIIIHDAPEREGYRFLYWKGSEYQPGDEYTVSEDHTFEEQWEKKSGPTPSPTPDDPSGGSGNTPAKTGDNSNIALWLALMIASLLSFAAMIYLRRRKKEYE